MSTTKPPVYIWDLTPGDRIRHKGKFRLITQRTGQRIADFLNRCGDPTMIGSPTLTQAFVVAGTAAVYRQSVVAFVYAGATITAGFWAGSIADALDERADRPRLTRQLARQEQIDRAKRLRHARHRRRSARR